jgi:hypothetical protein
MLPANSKIIITKSKMDYLLHLYNTIYSRSHYPTSFRALLKNWLYHITGWEHYWVGYNPKTMTTTIWEARDNIELL